MHSDVDFLDERCYGPIIPGSECSACGGALVQTSRGTYCDWCSSIVDAAPEDEEESSDDEGGESFD